MSARAKDNMSQEHAITTTITVDGNTTTVAVNNSATITLTKNATITVIQNTVEIDEGDKQTTIAADEDDRLTMTTTTTATEPWRDASWFQLVRPIDYQFVTAAAIYCYSFRLADMWKYPSGRRRRRHVLHSVDWSFHDGSCCCICEQNIAENAMCCPSCWRKNCAADSPFQGYMHLACWRDQRKPPGSFMDAMDLAMKNGNDISRDCKTCGLCLKQP